MQRRSRCLRCALRALCGSLSADSGKKQAPVCCPTVHRALANTASRRRWCRPDLLARCLLAAAQRCHARAQASEQSAATHTRRPASRALSRARAGQPAGEDPAGGGAAGGRGAAAHPRDHGADRRRGRAPPAAPGRAARHALWRARGALPGRSSRPARPLVIWSAVYCCRRRPACLAGAASRVSAGADQAPVLLSHLLKFPNTCRQRTGMVACPTAVQASVLCDGPLLAALRQCSPGWLGLTELPARPCVSQSLRTGGAVQPPALPSILSVLQRPQR